MAKLNTAESSASTPALFKEDLPRKMVFQEVWMNKHEMPPAKGRQLEAADEGTLMGRLAARMAARDFIDELNLGPSGRTSEAKKAQVADNGIPGKLHLEGHAFKGAGLHVQTSDKKAYNMSDPLPDKGVRKGSNMMEQAKNAGNVFHTMAKAPGKR